jgi:hypothetical protein
VLFDEHAKLAMSMVVSIDRRRPAYWSYGLRSEQRLMVRMVT